MYHLVQCIHIGPAYTSVLRVQIRSCALLTLYQSIISPTTHDAYEASSLGAMLWSEAVQWFVPARFPDSTNDSPITSRLSVEVPTVY